MSFLTRIFRRDREEISPPCCSAVEVPGPALPKGPETTVSLTCPHCWEVCWSMAVSRLCMVCGHGKGLSTSITSRGDLRTVILRWSCGHTKVHRVDVGAGA